MSRDRGRRWDEFRREILDRDGWRCTECGRVGRLEVDHIVQLHKGGDQWDPENCRTLCRDCHKARHRRPLTPEEEEWERLLDRLG
ncbi:MAG: HNH endonuclease [Gemmatimonadetes bacterium]|nr:HNH endonuclease [Gemmatimonadota bacterium]MYG37394.1 HNH endonuclease [Gemmatimonadota bacterium]